MCGFFFVRGVFVSLNVTGGRICSRRVLIQNYARCVRVLNKAITHVDKYSRRAKSGPANCRWASYNSHPKLRGTRRKGVQSMLPLSGSYRPSAEFDQVHLYVFLGYH